MPRRLAITGPYQAEVIEYTEPPLADDQVRVRTQWATGKHGTTTGMFDGRNFRGQEFDQDMRLFIERDEQDGPPTTSYDPPWNSGNTGAGVVTEVGRQVTRWKAGDRVFGSMDVRESNVCREERLWALGTIDPLLALCLDPAYVAFHCVREAQVRYGDTVAVVGLGAVGLLAVQMALHAGAETVIAVDMLPNRRAWAAANGADHVLDPREGDTALRIHELLGGPGADVAIEISGAYPALQTAIRAVRVGGTVCSAGFYQGETQGIWLGREWHHNRLTMVVPHGCGWGHPPRDYPRWDNQRANDTLVSLMRKGKLAATGLITPVVSLEDGPEVYRLIKDQVRRALSVKVTGSPITPSPARAATRVPPSSVGIKVNAVSGPPASSSETT
jgi:threonine dehydrogenase-like Zn-dependent dehydrogenase